MDEETAVIENVEEVVDVVEVSEGEKEKQVSLLKKLIEKHQLKNRLAMSNGFEKSTDTWICPTRSPFKSKKSRMRNKMRRKTQQQMRRKG